MPNTSGRPKFIEKPEDMIESCLEAAAARCLDLAAKPTSCRRTSLRATVQNGGLVLGALSGGNLTGVVFGFPGLEFVADGPRQSTSPICSPCTPISATRASGTSQARPWQIVRQQGIDRIAWTYDPLLSRNTWLNITRLGAVCSTYLKEYYGEIRDEMSLGVPPTVPGGLVGQHQACRAPAKRAPRRPLTLADYEKGRHQAALQIAAE